MSSRAWPNPQCDARTEKQRRIKEVKKWLQKDLNSFATRVTPKRVLALIANWIEEEQPRERLSRYGAAGMSTAELLAICLVSGVPGEDAVQLARRLLSEFGGISGLLAAPMDRLRAVHGVGLAKAAQIKAIQELGVRDTESVLVKAKCFRIPQRYLSTCVNAWARCPMRPLPVCFLMRKMNSLDSR